MKQISTLLIFLISLSNTFAQDKVLDELEILTNQNDFKTITTEYSVDYGGFSAKSLYYVGLAFYMTENDVECLKFMDLSILKDDTYEGAHFIKASTLNYMGKYGEAVAHFKIAIGLKADRAEFYSGLGDAYYQLEQLDLALNSYVKATELQNCPERAYSMVAQIYSDLKQNDKALGAYYVAKSKIDPQSASYVNALFNIGLMESLNGNYDKAEPVFNELIKISPDDYHSYAKLIQIHYHNQKYDKAKPLKNVLYSAHAKGKLKGTNLEDMFCIDQFEWKGHQVLVFERYQNQSKGNIYYKHIFYVKNKSDETVLSVQTEFSPVLAEMGGAKYMLCASKGGTHLNPGIGFGEDYEYADVKSAAVKLFELYLQ